MEGGDAVWVARLRSTTGGVGSAAGSAAQSANADTDFVLDLVVERKRLDDLMGSIKDDRYRRGAMRPHSLLVSLLASLFPRCAQASCDVARMIHSARGTGSRSSF